MCLLYTAKYNDYDTLSDTISDLEPLNFATNSTKPYLNLTYDMSNTTKLGIFVIRYDTLTLISFDKTNLTTTLSSTYVTRTLIGGTTATLSSAVQSAVGKIEDEENQTVRIKMCCDSDGTAYFSIIHSRYGILKSTSYAST